MSNRIKNGISGRMAEIGKIKIGRKAQGNPKTGQGGTWYPPQRLEHFIVVKPHRDKQKINYILDDEVMAALKPKYGAEPTEIPIILPFDDPEMIFQTSFALYKGKQCICRGDGETANMLFLKDGKPLPYTIVDDGPETVSSGDRRKIICDHINCPNRKPDSNGATACKPNGRLVCIVPASKRLNGYYFFRTTSYHTISYITKALDDMKIQTGGILKGIPAKLFFFKKATTDHGNVPVVSIDWDFDEIQAMRQAAIAEREFRQKFLIDMRQIEDQARASGILDDRDDPEDIVGEFYSETTPEYAEQCKAEESSVTARADAVLGDVEDFEPESQDEEESPPENEPKAAENEESGGDEPVPSLF